MAQQILGGGGYVKLSYVHGDVYAALQGGPVWTHLPSYGQITSEAGTLSNLRVYLSEAPGAGNFWQFSIQNSSGDGDIVVRISDDAVSGSDTEHTMSVSAGDWIRVRATKSGTPTLSFAYFTIDFEPDSEDSANLVMSYPHANVPDGSSIGYTALMSGLGWSFSGNNAAIQVIPTNGIIDNMYFGMITNVATGKSIICTLMVNGVETDITATIGAGENNASDTEHSVEVSAGDEVVYKVTKSDSGSWNAIFHGISFTPTNTGESIVMNSPGYTFSAPGNRYHDPCGNCYDNWDTEVGGHIQYLPATKFGKLYVRLAQDPLETYTINLLLNGAASGITCSIESPDTTGNDHSNEGSSGVGNTLELYGQATTGAADEYMGWGFVMNPDGLAPTGRTRSFAYIIG